MPERTIEEMDNMVEEARQHASKKGRELMDERGLGVVSTARSVGTDPGGLSRSLKGNFMMPIKALVPFCYNALGISLTDFFFEDGENYPVPMSNLLREVCRLWEEDLNPVEQAMLLEKARSMSRKAMKPGEILHRRTNDIAMDELIFGHFLYSDEVRVEKAVGQTFTRIAKNNKPSLIFLLFSSIALGYSLDFLAAQDCLRFNKERLAERPEAAPIAQQYYALDPEGQRELVGEVLAAAWKD